MVKELKIRPLVGKEIIPYIKDLARLRIEVFRDYPYLYEGSFSYEENYLKRFSDCPDAIVVFVFDGEKVVGASTGSPLKDAPDFCKPFIDKGLDISSFFYCGESTLLKEYRGQGIGNQFFDFREAHARKLNRFKYICFCAVERPENHPKRPASYLPLDEFWKKRGYIKHPELKVFFPWAEIGEKEETNKPLVFWIRGLP